jgi:hypothetical protein
MSCGLEVFSTEVSAAPPKVIAHVPPNELYINIQLTAVLGCEGVLGSLYYCSLEDCKKHRINVSF